MPSQTIEIVDDEGNVVEEEITTTDFYVDVNGEFHRPVITNEIEIENDSDMTSVSDQCGNVERNTVGNQGWKIRATGLVTGNDSRPNNLSLSKIRDVVALSDTITIESDLISGEFELSNTVITQSSDVAAIQTNATNGIESAYSFQLQLGETDT